MEKKIIRSNALIAEFMGHEDYQEMGEYVIPQYHKSWDLLMSVIAEIDPEYAFDGISIDPRSIDNTYTEVVNLIKGAQSEWR